MIQTVLVPGEMTGERLDKALAQTTLFPQGQPLSRTMVQRLIKARAIFRLPKTRLAGAAESPPQLVLSGTEKIRGEETFELHMPPLKSLEIAPEAIDLAILFEDNDLLVVNKPAGMASHPGAGINGYSGTLVNALLHHCRDSLSGIGGFVRPGIVHRLDKETSGLLVVAKNDRTHLHLSEQFKARTTERLYMAIVKGTPHPRRGEINAPIGRNAQIRQRMAVVPVRGRHAVTQYTVLEDLSSFSLISCRLKTGRTHQIRVHMAHRGHPLLGDPLYSRPFTPPTAWPEEAQQMIRTFQRQALHATMLGFIHPIQGERLHFEVEAPADFQQVLATLRQCHTALTIPCR